MAEAPQSTFKKGPWIILGLLLLLAGFFLLQRKGPVPSLAEKPTLVATVASSTGDVSAIDATNAASGVRVGDEVKAGETFTTGKDGYVSLEFYSGDRTALDANSKLKIEEASVDATNWQKQRVRLTLLAGRVWSRALKLLDKDSTYSVGYNNVIAVVRGTAFLVTAQDKAMTVDEIDGTVGFDGRDGELKQGRSVRLMTDNPKQNIQQSLYFTPDFVRNDLWVRHELRNDIEFAKRAADVRRAYGTDQSVATVGNEEGPYTLDIPPEGMTINSTATFTITQNGQTTNLGTAQASQQLYHNGYHGVVVTAKDQQAVIKPGGTLAMIATAMFEDADKPNVTRMEEVTTKATWEVLDETTASIDANGVLHAGPNASGYIQVIARYNDGTHEHSNTFAVPVR